MEQYIDKSALVAEIKRLLDRYISVHTFNYGATQDLNHLLSFLDTLEVKEKQKLIDEACKWLFENDSYAIPTNVQVDRLREHLNKMKGE